MYHVVYEGNVAAKHADNEHYKGNVLQGSEVCWFKAKAYKSFQEQSKKSRSNVHNSLELAAFAGSNGSSLFYGNHADEVHGHFAIQNKDEKIRLHVAESCFEGKHKADKGSHVNHYIGKGIEKFSKITYLVILAGKKTVQKIGKLHKAEKRNCNYHAFFCKKTTRPDWKEIKDKKYR